MTPTDLAILKSLLDRSIPKVVNGDKGDKGDSIKGDKGDSVKGDKGDSIKGDKGDSVKGDKGDSVKGDKGDSVKGDKGDTVKGDKGDSVKGDKGDSIKGDKGDDGRGIKSISVNDQDMLVVTYDDDDLTIAGKVSVKVENHYAGGNGLPADHFAIRSGSFNDDNELVLNANFGKQINVGAPKDPRSAIYVRKASQLAGTLDSTIIYIIDGHVDMGTQQIIVPINGLNVAGLSSNTSSLYSSADNYTMFQCVPFVGCGDFSLGFLSLRVEGTNSNVFNLDNLGNGGRIGWKSVNFNSCTSLGTIKSYSQALAQNVGWRDCLDGLICDGVWGGGWAILNSILLGADFEGTLFKAGDTLSLGGSFRSNINILKLDVDNGTFCDFAPSNIVLDGGFALSNVRVSPLADPLPNMPSTSIKVLIKDCIGLANTYAGAAHQPQSDSVITIAEAGALYQITGAVDLSESYWFSTANTNGLQLDSSLPLEVTTSGTMSFSGGSNTEMSIQIRKFVSSSSSYINIGPEYITTFSTSAVFGTLASNVSFSATTGMKLNDRIEVWVKNNTNTDDITLKSGGQFQVVER